MAQKSAHQLVNDLLAFIDNQGHEDNQRYGIIRESTLQDKRLCSEMTTTAIDWAVSNGLCMYHPTAPNACTHAPFTLLPVLLDRSNHTQLMSVSLIFHKLIDALSRDSNFLISCVQETAQSDPEFTGKMVALYQKQLTEKQMHQPYQLGIFRSDYMKDATSNRWGQIEFNTISASFGALSDLTFRLHKFLLSRCLGVDAVQPASNAVDEIAHALGVAAKLVHGSKGVVLMLIQKEERNISDQRRIEWALWQQHKIRLIRRTMYDVYKNGTLDGDTKELVLDGVHRVSAVYFRSGYTPNDYGPEGHEWKAREMIEFSTAIKCPSIAYHLIGSKIFQTIFCNKKVLLRYLADNEADQLLSVFVGLYSLEQSDTDSQIQAVINDARKNHDRYVLKPQREGGGNNFYGEDIVKKMDSLTANERRGYILMQRIYPKEIQTIQIRNFQSFPVKAICEMGIYSTFLGNGVDAPVIDDVFGTLLRTKQAQVTEGGVATGYAVLDSVVFCDDDNQASPHQL